MEGWLILAAATGRMILPKYLGCLLDCSVYYRGRPRGGAGRFVRRGRAGKRPKKYTYMKDSRKSEQPAQVLI